MKRSALLLAFFATFAISYGQNNSLGSSDPAAKKVLDAVSARFKTYKAVQAAFTLKVEDNRGKVQGMQKGTVMMKGPHYRISMTGKDAKEIFSNGSVTWTYDKAANEVTITQVDQSANTITPQKIFTNFYDKDFLYKLNGEKKIANKTIQEIELTPVDKTKQFHKVFVLVDKNTQTVSSMSVLEKNGNKFTYTVTSFNGKAPLNDSVFVFDKKKYPGVEEVDLR